MPFSFFSSALCGVSMAGLIHYALMKSALYIHFIIPIRGAGGAQSRSIRMGLRREKESNYGFKRNLAIA